MRFLAIELTGCGKMGTASQFRGGVRLGIEAIASRNWKLSPFFGVFCIAVSCGAIFGQPKPARISGRVTDQSGNALRRATVKLLGAQNYSQVSDDNGAFAIDNVNPGKYSLIGQRAGYSTQKYGAPSPLIRDCANAETTGLNALGNSIVQECIERAPGTTLIITGEQALNEITVRLFQQGSISGRLTDQDGDALQNWNVQVLRAVYLHGARQLQVGGQANSNPDGGFVIANVPAGRYYLRALNGNAQSAALVGDLPLSKPPMEADLPTYFPNVAEESRAAPLDLEPGAELHGIDVQVRRSRVYSIRGSISGPQSNAELSDQILSLAAKGRDRVVAPARVRPDGTFEFRGVEPGTYTVQGGQAFGNRGVDPVFGQQEITVTNASVENVRLALSAGADVSGLITIEGTKPSVPLSVALQQMGSAAVDGVGTQVNADGSFHVGRKLAPTNYVVTFPRGLHGVYVKSIRFGNQDVLHAPLDLSGGGGTIDIVLSSKVGAIAGAAPPGVVVTAWPRIPQTSGGVKSASADQNGHFEISDLGPGDYFVAAWQETDPGLLQEPDFLARFQGEGSMVALEEGGGARADVKVITREAVAREVAKLP